MCPKNISAIHKQYAVVNNRTKAKKENDDRPRNRLRKSEWRFGGLSTHIVKSHPPDSANFDSEFGELGENGFYDENTSNSNGSGDDQKLSDTLNETGEQSPLATENNSENTAHSPVNVENKEPAVDLNDCIAYDTNSCGPFSPVPAPRKTCFRIISDPESENANDAIDNSRKRNFVDDETVSIRKSPKRSLLERFAEQVAHNQAELTKTRLKFS